MLAIRSFARVLELGNFMPAASRGGGAGGILLPRLCDMTSLHQHLPNTGLGEALLHLLHAHCPKVVDVDRLGPKHL